MDYINLLPSTKRMNDLTEVERDNFFFETFPAKWRQDFVTGSRVDYYNARSNKDIKQFMMMKKKTCDSEDNKN